MDTECQESGGGSGPGPDSQGKMTGVAAIPSECHFFAVNSTASSLLSHHRGMLKNQVCMEAHRMKPRCEHRTSKDHLLVSFPLLATLVMPRLSQCPNTVLLYIQLAPMFFLPGQPASLLVT